MKSRIIPWLLFAFAAIAGVVWLGTAPQPVIHFVGFQPEEQTRWALLRIENRSRRPFTYLGITESFPRFSYRIQGPSGWHVVDSTMCSRPLTLPARSSIDIRVPFPKEPGPFQIGILFKRGTEADYYRPPRYAKVRSFLWRLGISLPSESTRLTWSPTIGS